MNTITLYISKIIDKLTDIFSSATGWFIGLVTWLVTFLGDEKGAFYTVIAAVLWDMIWGVLVSRKKGERFFLSYLGRETGLKLFVYVGSLFLALCIERGLDDSWGLAFRVICGLAAACEIWSASANILIIKPNFPFLRLIRGALIGEIASKLDISKEEVKNMMFKDDKNKITKK